MSRPTVLATVCSDSFEPGFIVAFNSLLEHNPWFDLEVRVLWHPALSPLSHDAQERMSRVYDRLTFIEADLDQQRDIRERMISEFRTQSRLFPAFLVLEAFRFTDADRVVALDLDVLVIGDVRELFDCGDQFAAVEAEHAIGGKRGFFNSGVFVAGAQHLTGDTYSDLVCLPVENMKNGWADQAILNSYFPERGMGWLPNRFNSLRSLHPDHLGDIDMVLGNRDIRILHFAGLKPWNAKEPQHPHANGFDGADRLWSDAFCRYACDGDMERMLTGREQRLRQWAEKQESPSFGQ
ncbi:MAG: hypothetical protein GWP48_01040 [Actinobacteria bacterium]|nr:hypothetical protein [Actinomycetota bacterium]